MRMMLKLSKVRTEENSFLGLRLVLQPEIGGLLQVER